MDGYHPNAFLAKKLKTEGILNDEPVKTDEHPKQIEPKSAEHKIIDELAVAKEVPEIIAEVEHSSPSTNEKVSPQVSPKKRISDTSEESDTQVIIEKVEKPQEIPGKILEIQEKIEKRKSAEVLHQEPIPTKRRRSSPIVFDVKEKEREKDKETDRERTRTESAGSDNHVIVTTTTSSHKYDTLPPCKLYYTHLLLLIVSLVLSWSSCIKSESSLRYANLMTFKKN